MTCNTRIDRSRANCTAKLNRAMRHEMTSRSGGRKSKATK